MSDGVANRAQAIADLKTIIASLEAAKATHFANDNAQYAYRTAIERSIRELNSSVDSLRLRAND